MAKDLPNPFADLEELVVPAAKPVPERIDRAAASIEKMRPDSIIRRLLELPADLRSQAVMEMPSDAIDMLGYSWEDWARQEQLAPDGTWNTWLILAGRGFGKTRAGAEFIRAEVNRGVKRLVLVGRTAPDVRDTMIFGESGIMAITPPAERPKYVRSDRCLIWPGGAHALLATAMEPDILRGPQFASGWCDELAAWAYPEAWSNLQMALRLGENPRAVATTTPRPTDLIRALVRDSTTRTTKGSTYDNAGNLPANYINLMTSRYAGTRLGRQELDAEILDDTSGALWKAADIPHIFSVPEPLMRVVVGVDPSVQAQGLGDEVGIVAVGVGRSGRGYVLEDASGSMGPTAWAEATIRVANRWGADAIVAEGNQGGELVRINLHAAPLLTPQRIGLPDLRQVVIPPIVIVHARVGKVARAEPVVALYEQRRMVHVGVHAALEDQMTTWIPQPNAKSPGRIDGLVWAATALHDTIQFRPSAPSGTVRALLVQNAPLKSAY